MTRQPRLLTLSAPTPAQLELVTDELAGQLEAMDDAAFAGLPVVPAPQAAPGALRRAVFASTPGHAARWLRKRDPRRVFTGRPGVRTSRVFLFSGVGDHYPGLCAGLYRCLPAFRGELCRCLRELAVEHGLDLRSVLFPPDALARPGPEAVFDQCAVPQEIHRTVVAQPLLFALQYSLARAMTALGAGPSALAGYSVGEFSAACVAGVFTLEHALRVVTQRARMVDELPAGAMLAVATGPEPLRRLDGPLSLAALNGPEQTVLSGPAEAIEDAARQLTEEGVACQRLATSHAFHSAMMEPLADSLEKLVRRVPLYPPGIHLLSGVTGTWLRDEQATSPAYWARQLCRTIRFSDEVAEIWRLPAPLLVEIGPGQTLARLALGHRCRPVDAAANIVQTLPGRLETRTEWEVLLTAAGRLWAAGAPIGWDGLAEEHG